MSSQRRKEPGGADLILAKVVGVIGPDMRCNCIGIPNPDPKWFSHLDWMALTNQSQARWRIRESLMKLSSIFVILSYGDFWDFQMGSPRWRQVKRTKDAFGSRGAHYSNAPLLFGAASHGEWCHVSKISLEQSSFTQRTDFWHLIWICEKISNIRTLPVERFQGCNMEPFKQKTSHRGIMGSAKPLLWAFVFLLILMFMVPWIRLGGTELGI